MLHRFKDEEWRCCEPVFPAIKRQARKRMDVGSVRFRFDSPLPSECYSDFDFVSPQ